MTQGMTPDATPNTTQGMRCQGEPISWLRLERYRAQLSSEAERAEVAEHLMRCELCRACYERTASAVTLRPLTLDDAMRARLERTAERTAGPRAETSPSAVRTRAQNPRRNARVLLIASPLLAAAAALLLFLRSNVAPDPSAEVSFPAWPAARVRVKGGELELELARMSAHGTLEAPTHFAPGDRWKPLVSCPPSLAGRAELVVYQDGEASFPLPTLEPSCHNREALPFAFTLEGQGPATVCVVLGGARAPSRKALAAGRNALPSESACVQMEKAGH